MKSTFQGLKMKFYWKTVTPLSLYYLWLLSLCNGGVGSGRRDSTAHWMQHIHHLAIVGSLPTPDLWNCLLRESAFSYIDSYGPKEIRYFQRARMSLFPCLPLDFLLSFLHYNAIPEKVVYGYVSLTLFLKDFFWPINNSTQTVTLVLLSLFDKKKW